MYTSKHELRAYFKQAREAFVNEHGKQDFLPNILNLLESLSLKTGIIGIYLPIGFEADISMITEDARFSQYHFALPQVSEDHSMKFVSYAPGKTELVLANYGFMQPVSGDIVVPDVILAPLLSFDREGNRLGYGKGHYDTYIDSTKKDKPFHFVGVAFPVQESMETLPTHTGDQKLDAILLPDTYIVFRT